MILLGNILEERMKAYTLDPKGVEEQVKARGKEYNKKWNDAVQFFQKQINREREKDGMKPLGFMPIRYKLMALPEIDELRWFYHHCIKYSKTKDKMGNWNTFSKCFWGALDAKKCK